jgi:hypothetical protein
MRSFLAVSAGSLMITACILGFAGAPLAFVGALIVGANILA